jgi:hypothetical protein
LASTRIQRAREIGNNIRVDALWRSSPRARTSILRNCRVQQVHGVATESQMLGKQSREIYRLKTLKSGAAAHGHAAFCVPRSLKAASDTMIACCAPRLALGLGSARDRRLIVRFWLSREFRNQVRHLLFGQSTF